MSYFQKHLRNYLPQNKSQPQAFGQPLKSKKINCQRVKTDHSAQHSKRHLGKDQQGVIKNEPIGRHQLERKSVKVPARFATEGPTHDMPEEPMRAIFADTDNSMEQMLNSSMNQLEQILNNRDHVSQKNSQLIQQNQQLKDVVEELMNLLKTKLDKALQKQEEELKGVMSDYLQLITKLLADKEELTGNLEDAEEELKETRNKVKVLEHQLEQTVSVNEERELQMKNYIEKLEDHLKQVQKEPLLNKLQSQNCKISTLYQLLQSSEQQKKNLHELVTKLQSQDGKYKTLEGEFETKLEQKERQFEQIFQEYDKVMKQAIQHKDVAISRLNRMVESRVTEEPEGTSHLINFNNI